jgi:TFIIF-interacting CTD phosphatase-like protein
MVSFKIIKFIDPMTDDYETFEDAKGHTLLIDPDEDPELAAKIDAELLIVGKTQLDADQKPQPPYLPQLPADRKYTLVLDLDETLIHYRDEEEYYLVRPGVDKFLSELSELYDIVLFTAGVK